ncbi:hypothetical protein, partial [Chryseobacterium sp. Leaf405]|uniref:hypothetical protein n=1 Tax=Chryseobacterium sp. Leaf405 TaxID=1736367 RepID=UPI000A501559
MEENNAFLGGILNDPEMLAKHFSGKTYRQFSEEKHSPQVYSFIYIDGKEFKGSCQIEIIQHTG